MRKKRKTNDERIRDGNSLILKFREADKKWLKRSGTVLACLVAFVTTYTLILPAVTLTDPAAELQCDIPLHQHSDSCYVEELVFDSPEDTVGHVERHTVCGYADYVVHTHDEACYDAEGNLICNLPEIPEHQHDETCYTEQRILVCGQEESDAPDGHIHTDECYEIRTALTCGQLELHTHTDECFDENGQLICGQTQLLAHQHDASCLPVAQDDTDDSAADAEATDADAATQAEDGTAGAVAGTSGQDVSEDSDDEADAATDDGDRTDDNDSLRTAEDGADDSDAARVHDTKSDSLNDRENGNSGEATMVTGLLRMTGSVNVDDVTITAGCDIGVLPEGVQLKATVVDKEAYADKVAEATGKKDTAVKTFDIQFVDADGQEVEPDGDVRVTFEADFIEKKTDPEIVHIHDDGQAELVESRVRTGELTMKTDSFSVYAISYTVDFHEEVVAASGESYVVTVTYDEKAEIPNGADLKVREILLNDEDYGEYYRQSMEKLGAAALGVADEAEMHEDTVGTEKLSNDTEATGNSYARIFDIEIWADNQKIEPAANVSVSIRLLDAPEDENADLKIVHFGMDGLEVMDLTGNGETKKEGFTEIEFVTDEFSVYSVVDAREISDFTSDGPYILVGGISYNKEYWTEQWGHDYFTIITNAYAVTDSVKNNSLVPISVHVWENETDSFVGGTATQWRFEKLANGNYYIYTDKGYIRHSGAYSSNGNLDIVARNQATEFTVDKNTDGTILIHSGNWYLQNAGGTDEWSTRIYQLSYQNSAPSSDIFKFKLCRYSSDFDGYAAQKISAAEIVENKKYVIYRKFIDEEENETLYALAQDGSFVPVYDGGDTVYWRKTDKNIYWNYKENGDYPTIFTTDPETGNKIYLSPDFSTKRTTSSESTGLTLAGKDNGQYRTSIECWDQKVYDYAGLHVAGSGDEKDLTVGTRVAGTSDDFLFALAGNMPSNSEPEMVPTVDSEKLGIHITVFDYGEDKEYSAGTKLDDMTNIAGSAEYKPHAAHALVKSYLENGVPSSLTKGSMTGLFSSGGAIKYSQSNVTNLFLQSYYDENGTFRYRSEDNYAYLGKNNNTKFTVYRQAATPYTHLTDGQVGHSYYYHGHYMPFNDIDMTQSTSRLMNQYANEYDEETGKAIGELPIGDGRAYGELYGVHGTPNFYTGMKMEAAFTQPEGGITDSGDDMIFKFTGDDDMWVYIDGVLVLDVGGIHEPLSGTVNFRTGVVTNPEGSSLPATTTLREIFENVKNANSTPQSVKDKIDKIVWNGDTFADYTNHDFSAFYMERGAGASNLDLQFNLKVILTNEFTVSKKLPLNIDTRFVNQEYRFHATYKDKNGGEHPLHAGIQNVCTDVVYKNSGQSIKIDDNGYFTLRAGEEVVFKMVKDDIPYKIEEVAIDNTLNDDVEINDKVVQVSNEAASTDYAASKDRSQVAVTNHPHTQDLRITKFITIDSAPIEEGENPVFEFRVYLETTETVVDTTKDPVETTTMHRLVPYSYGPYYLVKKVEVESEGEKVTEVHYFTLDGENNAPRDRGSNKVVCSTTGKSGSINSIPPEYTIVIPDLTVGTNFYVEERRDNIPKGYEYVNEELVSGTYDQSSLVTKDSEGKVNEDVIKRVIARDEKDLQEFDPDTVGRIMDGKDAESRVFNKKTPIEITVKKNWEGLTQNDAKITVRVKRYRAVDITGNLTINGTMTVNPSDPGADVVYKVMNGNNEVMSVKHSDMRDGSITIPIPIGEYKIVATGTLSGYSATHSDEELVTITEDCEKSVTFTSKYEQVKKDLVITKEVKNKPDSITFDATYTVTNQETGVSQTITREGLNNGSTMIATLNLPIGTYVITENITNGENPGDDYTASHISDRIGGEVVLTESEDGCITFISEYKQKTQPVYVTAKRLRCSDNGGQGYDDDSAKTDYNNQEFIGGSELVISWKYTNGLGTGALWINNQLIQSYSSNDLNKTCTYRYKLPETNSVNIVVTSNWGGWNVDEIKIEYASDSNQALNKSTFAAFRNSGINRQTQAEGITDFQNENDLPKELQATPDPTRFSTGVTTKKYAVDQSWYMDVVLENGVWTKNAVVSKMDMDGFLYYYFIDCVKEEHVDPSTVATIDLNLQGKQRIASDDASIDNKNKELSLTNTLEGDQRSYSLRIVKVAGGTTTGLSGAKFQLTRKLDGESSFTRFENDRFEETAGSDSGQTKKDGSFTVTSTDGIVLAGLLPGTYQIQETKAPDGYIITMGAFEFEIKTDGSIEMKAGSGTSLITYLEADGEKPAGFQIENQPGAALPNTGGSGTHLFCLLGGILIALAGAGLVMKRRKRDVAR